MVQREQLVQPWRLVRDMRRMARRCMGLQLVRDMQRQLVQRILHRRLQRVSPSWFLRRRKRHRWGELRWAVERRKNVKFTAMSSPTWVLTKNFMLNWIVCFGTLDYFTRWCLAAEWCCWLIAERLLYVSAQTHKLSRALAMWFRKIYLAL